MPNGKKSINNIIPTLKQVSYMKASTVDDKKSFSPNYLEYLSKAAYSRLWLYIVNMISYSGGEWIITVCLSTKMWPWLLGRQIFCTYTVVVLGLQVPVRLEKLGKAKTEINPLSFHCDANATSLTSLTLRARKRTRIRKDTRI